MSQNKELSTAQQFMSEVRSKLTAYKDNMAKILPANLTPEKVIEVAYHAVRKNPELQKCSSNSIVSCVLMACQLGFEFDGISNKAHMVPYWNSKTKRLDAQFQIGYRGLIELAERSGKVKLIEARPVYKDDFFECYFGSNGKLNHIPNWNAPRLDEDIIGFYALAHLDNGLVTYDFMTKEEIDKVMSNTKSKDKDGKLYSSSPWSQHYVEMGKKTIIRRFCKMLPSTTILDKAVAWDNQAAVDEKQSVDGITEVIEVESYTQTEDGEVVKNEVKSKAEQAADEINVEDI